ncbi:MAG TPA: hypothetical protein VJH95_00500 [Candidatus Nanoarchaeia archaeon]|nr:hypothetical protein [Candidatus Nanoarchaeia archaeon]
MSGSSISKEEKERLLGLMKQASDRDLELLKVNIADQIKNSEEFKKYVGDILIEELNRGGLIRLTKETIKGIIYRDLKSSIKEIVYREFDKNRHSLELDIHEFVRSEISLAIKRAVNEEISISNQELKKLIVETIHTELSRGGLIRLIKDYIKQEIKYMQG